MLPAERWQTADPFTLVLFWGCMPTFSQRHVLLVISWVIIFGGLLLVLPLRLLPSLLAGLLVFELVNMLTPQLQRLIEGRRARWVAVALLGTLVVSVLSLIFAGAFSFLLHEAENPGASWINSWAWWTAPEGNCRPSSTRICRPAPPSSGGDR